MIRVHQCIMFLPGKETKAMSRRETVSQPQFCTQRSGQIPVSTMQRLSGFGLGQAVKRVSQSGSEARKKPELSIVFYATRTITKSVLLVSAIPTNQSLLLHYLDSKKQGGAGQGTDFLAHGYETRLTRSVDVSKPSHSAIPGHT